jgi:hypothetical protein
MYFFLFFIEMFFVFSSFFEATFNEIAYRRKHGRKNEAKFNLFYDFLMIL